MTLNGVVQSFFMGTNIFTQYVIYYIIQLIKDGQSQRSGG